jgi:hypothetical protein
MCSTLKSACDRNAPLRYRYQILKHPKTMQNAIKKALLEQGFSSLYFKPMARKRYVFKAAQGREAVKVYDRP